MTEHVRVKLKEFSFDEMSAGSTGEITYRYLIEHNNGKTSLEQTLSIYSVPALRGHDWVATVSFDDFPVVRSPADAAMKMADWLERMAIAIRKGKFHDFNESEYIELEDA